MIKFIKTKDPDNEYCRSNVEITIEDNNIDLDNILEEFGCFLQACGYVIKGDIVIEEDK